MITLKDYMKSFLNERKIDEAVEESKDLTKTKEFKSWFGKSKIKKKGEPMVVYHGTSREFDTFWTTSELGAHFGDVTAAKTINGYKSGAIIMPVWLSIQKPLRTDDMIDFDPPSFLDYATDEKKIFKSDVLNKLNDFKSYAYGLPISNPKQIRFAEAEILKLGDMVKDEIKKMGYDGIVYQNTREGTADSYIAFDANQIKSIYNNGKFSKSGNIYK